MGYAGKYQAQILADGGSPFPFTMEGWEEAARSVLPSRDFDYFAGGAGRETTLVANREAFDRWGITYKVLREEGYIDPARVIVGTPMSVPIMLAPAGVAELAHPDAEKAAARAAAATGVVQVLSATTSTSLEEVAKAAPEGRRWFQFAWPDDEPLARSLVTRAERADYSALVIMGDCYVAGWRPRELAAGFSPFLAAAGLGNYLSDSRFREIAGLDDKAHPREESSSATRAAAETWNRVFTRPSFRPRDLERLRSWTTLPIIVKGVCNPSEAVQLSDAGADALIVSNHGGRQLDNGVAALDCLSPVLTAVADRIPVLFDSGIRSGTDAFIALALGARAVLVGRAWLYALAVGGQAGVEHLLNCLKAEFTNALALTGHRHCDTLSPQDLTPTTPVRQRGPR